MELGDGSLAAGLLAAAGWLGRRGSRRTGLELWQTVRAAIEGRLVIKREQARHDAIVAMVAALPLGAMLVDQPADGSRLTICLPSCDATGEDHEHDG